MIGDQNASYVIGLTVLAFVVFCLWLNIANGKARSKMTPREREELKKETERVPGDW